MREMFNENNLMIINNNEELELTKDGIKLIRKMQKAKVELAKMEEQLKEMFLNKMEENNVTKYVSPDGTFKATYYKVSTTNRFDSKRFQEEHQNLYKEYLKTSSKKAYVKFN